jgi:hypothetical protein
VVFLLIEFPLRQQKLCVFYFPLCLIFVDTCCTHFIFRSQFNFSDFSTTNNEAEYEAVIAGLSLAEHLEAKNLEVRSDSQVVVGHIQGGSEAKGEKNDKIPCQGFGFLGPLRRSGGHTDPEN